MLRAIPANFGPVTLPGTPSSRWKKSFRTGKGAGGTGCATCTGMILLTVPSNGQPTAPPAFWQRKPTLPMRRGLPLRIMPILTGPPPALCAWLHAPPRASPLRRSMRRCLRCTWDKAGCMAAPARTAHICKSPRLPAMAPSTPRPTIWRDIRFIAWSIRCPALAKTSPGTDSSPPAPTSSWTWIPTAPRRGTPPSSITKAPCTPSAGCFVIPTPSWCWTAATRTTRPGPGLRASLPSGR